MDITVLVHELLIGWEIVLDRAIIKNLKIPQPLFGRAASV
jgi:hypothetical protein